MTVARCAKAVNIKKAQFMAPAEMGQVLRKVKEAGGTDVVWFTERGSMFGYNNLVVDFRNIPEMRKLGHPVVFDATHSVQQPAGQGDMSGGSREHVPALARAATAIGVDALFLEVHPDPDRALSDSATQIDFPTFRSILKEALAIRRALGT
jgi:2-dehydro-3-deoxyphosphooctonate aldolase (KDO 8-P synthase)